MKKTTIAAGFLAFLGAGLLLGVLIRTPTAEIEIVQETVDLGKVGTGRVYSGTFVVENRGRGPLEVELQKVSCSCTVTEMCDSPIAPRKRGTITARISVPESEGPFGSTFTLRTNDPRRPQVILSIRGIAETVMKAAPPSLLFGDIGADQLPQSRRLVIRPGKLATPNMFACLKATCENEYFQVETERKGEEVDVLVTLRKEAPLGAVRSSIVLSVAEFNNYEIAVPVVGCVTGDYEIRPTCLFYGRLGAGAIVTRECHIAPLVSGETLEVAHKDLLPGASLDVNIEYRGPEAVVKGVLHAGSRFGTCEGVLTLRITTTGTRQPQHLQVPIIFVVANSREAPADSE